MENTIREILEDQLKDFTVRQMERRGVWYNNHIDRCVTTYDYIQIGAKVRLNINNVLEMHTVKAVEMIPPSFSGDSIHVILSNGYRCHYYELLPN